MMECWSAEYRKKIILLFQIILQKTATLKARKIILKKIVDQDRTELFTLPAKNFESKYFSWLRLLQEKYGGCKGWRTVLYCVCGWVCVCLLRTWALSSCSFACARQLPKKREKKIVKLHLLHFVFL